MRVPREYPHERLRAQGAQQRGRGAGEGEEAGRGGAPRTRSWPTSTRAPAKRRTRCSPPRASRRTSPITTGPRRSTSSWPTKYPQNPHAADALRSAGVLRQSLGQHDKRHQALRRIRARATRTAPTPRTSRSRPRWCARIRRTGAAPPPASAPTPGAIPATRAVVEAHAREADAHLKAGNDNAAKDAAPRRCRLLAAAANTAASARPTAPRRRNYCGGAGPLHPGRARLPRLREASRSRASRASSPRCSRRRRSGSRRRSRSTSTS